MAALFYNSVPYYTFSNITIRPCGATGNTGPTLTQCVNYYNTNSNANSTWIGNTQFFNMPYAQGIQAWTVPATGSYSLTVAGAAGGAAGNINSGIVNLTQGDILYMVVGQSSYNNSGAGGTFIFKNMISVNTVLFVAGGGGGGNAGNIVLNTTYSSSITSIGSVRDTNNNVYILGSFGYSASPIALRNMNGTTSAYSLPSGVSGSCIIKYNSSGAVVAFTYITTGLFSITTDPSNNVYACGQAQAPTLRNIDQTASTSFITAPGAIGPGTAMLLLRWDSNGILVAISEFGSYASYGIAVTADANFIYFAGLLQGYSGNTTIKNLAGGNVSSSYSFPYFSTSTIVIIKYNSGGVVQSFSYLSCKPYTNSQLSLIIDSSGYLFFAGCYNSSTNVTINNIDTAASSTIYTLPSTPTNIDNGFIIRYDATGNLVGFSYISSTNDSVITSIKIDTSAPYNLYATGFYTSTTTVPIRNITLTAPTTYSLPISSGQDAFLIRYTSGDFSVNGFSYLSGSGTDAGYTIATDTTYLYIAGSYNSSNSIPLKTLSVTPTNSTYSLPSTSASSGFIIQYSINSGNITGYSYYSSKITSVTIDSSGYIYVIGDYNSATQIRNIYTQLYAPSPYSLSTPGTTSLYIVQYANVSSSTVVSTDSSTLQGKIVKVGTTYITGDTGNYINTSTNLTTWTRTAVTQTGLVFAINGSTIVGVRPNSYQNEPVSTNGGTSWTTYNIVFNAWNGIAYGAGYYVVVGTYGKGGALASNYSSDLSTWTAGTGLPTVNLYNVIYANSKFIAVGDSGTIATSLNGTSWSYVAPQSVYPLYNIIYANSTFVAIGQNIIYYSTDNGSTWNSANGVPTGYWSDITYTGTQFIVVDQANLSLGYQIAPLSNGTQIIYSTDGINWSVGPNGTYNYISYLT